MDGRAAVRMKAFKQRARRAEAEVGQAGLQVQEVRRAFKYLQE